jgi:hypothetical protein
MVPTPPFPSIDPDDSTSSGSPSIAIRCCAVRSPNGEDKNFKRTFFPAPPGTTPSAREAAWQAASRSFSSPRRLPRRPRSEGEEWFKRLGLLLQWGKTKACIQTSGTVAMGRFQPSGTRGDAAEGLLLGEKLGHRPNTSSSIFRFVRIGIYLNSRSFLS